MPPRTPPSRRGSIDLLYSIKLKQKIEKQRLPKEYWFPNRSFSINPINNNILKSSNYRPNKVARLNPERILRTSRKDNKDGKENLFKDIFMKNRTKETSENIDSGVPFKKTDPVFKVTVDPTTILVEPEHEENEESSPVQTIILNITKSSNVQTISDKPVYIKPAPPVNSKAVLTLVSDENSVQTSYTFTTNRVLHSIAYKNYLEKLAIAKKRYLSQKKK